MEPNPPGFEGFLFLHFLDLERSWAWQIPMRNGITSVGVVTDKKDFQKSGKSGEEFFGSLMKMNRSLTHIMRDAERTRPWWIEADYSYEIDRLVDLAEEKRTAIMCAEAVPWRCHRSLIGDALLVRGVRVEDIMSAASRRDHVLTPFASVRGKEITYPGEETMELFAKQGR